MPCEFIKSKYPGIRYREHPTRKNGIRKDRYFVIRYKINGKDKNEGYGWESQGASELEAYKDLCQIKQNIKKGEGFTSLAEKRQMLLEEKEKQQIETLENEKKTIANFYDNIYASEYQPNHSIGAQTWEKITFIKYIKPAIGSKKFDDVTPLDIEQIKNEMKKQNKAPATINKCIGLIRLLFNIALANNYCTNESPTKKVKPLKFDNRRVRYLTKDEAKLLLDRLIKMKDRQLHDMSYLGLYCGLRASEIFNLTWTDINFNDKTILIRDPKNSKNRQQPMTVGVYNMLKCRQNKKTGQLIFTTATGEKIKEISRQFDRIVKELGLNNNIDDNRQKVVFHTLRHTYASWLALKGVDLYTISILMGHSDTNMTQRYSHLSPQKFANAIAELEELPL